MHRQTPKDIKPIDTDGMGFNARETFHPAPGHPLVFQRPLGVSGRTVDFSPRRMEAEDAKSLRQSLGSGGMRYNYSDAALAKATARANRPRKGLTGNDLWLAVGLTLAGLTVVIALVYVL